jgi:hypothetical protein
MSVLPFERRRRRSSNTFEAITLQLEYILQEQGLRNFVLGDDRGLLVAHAGHRDDAHVLAAYAPVIAQCRDKERYYEVIDGVREHVPEVGPSTVAFRTFEVDGHVLHLAIVGAGRLDHANVYRAVGGVRRILGESTQVAA